ncbi:MAG: DUF6320 domain-containing protein [Bacilli bacterium]
MRVCDKCKVQVKTIFDKCPLCQNNLKGEIEEESYPFIPTIFKKYFTFFKILLFTSIVICLICIGLDIVLKLKFHFSIYVVGGFSCLLLVLKIALSKRENVCKSILWQVVIISILAFLWDYFNGFLGWSVTYVIPILCAIGSVNMVILGVILKNYFDEYLIYFINIALVGLVPIIFILTGIVTNNIASVICIILNLISFLSMIIFRWDILKSELERRLHI